MASHIYVGTSSRTGGSISGVFRRDAEGGSWEQQSTGLPPETHAHAITVHPDDPAIIFAATHAGLYRSLNHGGRWERLVAPEAGEQFWSVLVHPADHRTILAGTAPLGLYRSDDGGDTWRRMPRPAIPERMVGAFPSRIMRMGVSLSRPDEIYAGMEVNGAMRSDDGGETWQDCSDPLVNQSQQPDFGSAILTRDPAEGMLDVHAICVSSTVPGTAFLALRMGLFRTQDRGDTWQDLGIGQHAAHLRYGRDIVAAPQDANVMYACVADSSRGKTGRLYRSQDMGSTWRQFDHSIDVRSTMMAVALDPRDAGRVHCVARGGQSFSTLDGGRSWQEHDLPAGCGTAVAIACG
jgi:photosystem II stability/assembly factor-like uncharacterized protein